jgi:hypothetical protein
MDERPRKARRRRARQKPPRPLWRRVVLWALVAATVAVGLAMTFWTLPRISDAAGGAAPFDLRPFGYSGDEARAFLSALTPEGRALYLGPQRMLDLFYPAALSALLALGLWRITRDRPRAVRRGLVAVALLGGLADHLENALVAGLLHIDPAAVTDGAVAWASTATVAKSMLTAAAALALLGLAGLHYARGRR